MLSPVACGQGAPASERAEQWFPKGLPRWCWGVLCVWAWAGAAAWGQELPGGNQQDFERYRSQARRSIATAQAVIPLRDIFDLRFSVRDQSEVRDCLAWAAQAPQASPLVRSRSEYRLSVMDVEAGRLAAAVARRRGLGVIMDWFVIGAFRNEGKAGFGVAYESLAELIVHAALR